MLKRRVAQSILGLMLVAVGVLASACSSTKSAEPQTMAPQQEPHERHATGLESQVGDY